MAVLANAISCSQQSRSQDSHQFGDSESLLRVRPVITRFCGISPGSSSGFNLLSSICLQLHLVLSHDRHELSAFNPDELSYDALVSHFHRLLQENAVVLLIDSLDQLSDENLARSHLSFLKGLKPHRDTRIIVSTLPDDPAPGL